MLKNQTTILYLKYFYILIFNEKYIYILIYTKYIF